MLISSASQNFIHSVHIKFKSNPQMHHVSNALIGYPNPCKQSKDQNGKNSAVAENLCAQIQHIHVSQLPSTESHSYGPYASCRPWSPITNSKKNLTQRTKVLKTHSLLKYFFRPLSLHSKTNYFEFRLNYLPYPPNIQNVH